MVKRRLESYQDLITMSEAQSARAVELGERYRDIATPGCLPISRTDPPGSGSSEPKESVYLDIFSEQMEAERLAKEYKAEAERIRIFLDAVETESERKEILVRAYLNGETYWSIGQDIGYTKSGITRIIHRVLLSVPSSFAQACGLL